MTSALHQYNVAVDYLPASGNEVTYNGRSNRAQLPSIKLMGREEELGGLAPFRYITGVDFSRGLNLDVVFFDEDFIDMNARFATVVVTTNLHNIQDARQASNLWKADAIIQATVSGVLDVETAELSHRDTNGGVRYTIRMEDPLPQYAKFEYGDGAMEELDLSFQAHKYTKKGKTGEAVVLYDQTKGGLQTATPSN